MVNANQCMADVPWQRTIDEMHFEGALGEIQAIQRLNASVFMIRGT
jgi:hypothetical protein